jgi:hypothetical protein
MYINPKEAHERTGTSSSAASALGMDLFTKLEQHRLHATNFAPVWGTPMGVGDTALLFVTATTLKFRSCLP